MLPTFIKYFFIILSSILTFSKLINYKRSKHCIFISILFTILLSIFMLIIRRHCAYLFIFTLVVFLIIYNKLVFKKDTNISIVFSIFSLGISYILLFIATINFTPLFYFLENNMSSTFVLNSLASTIAGTLQLIYIHLIFKLKRLKNGIPYAHSSINGDMSVFISVIILIIASSFFFLEYKMNIMLIFFSITPLLAVIIYLWIKNYIKSVYIERVHRQNELNYQNTLAQKNEEILYLKEHNAALSKIIHEDNKLLPAMKMAVENVIECKDLKKADELLTDIKTRMKDRSNTVSTYESKNHFVQYTNVASTDGVINYLINKAESFGIAFDFLCSVDFHFFIKEAIDVTSFNTLLADLGENAIIATKTSTKKNILITLSLAENIYSLNVFDSGIDFTPDSFQTLGLDRTTTYLNKGGSGIGIMSILEISKQAEASFEVNELVNSQVYTKCLSVRFDNKKHFRVKTQRPQVIAACSSRSDIILTN